MSLRVSAAMALCLLFPLMAVSHCAPLKAGFTNNVNASSLGIPAAEVLAVSDEEGLLHLPSSDDSVMPEEEEAVKPVAEPDPDRSHPSSDGEEDLTAKKLSPEGQQGDEKTKDQIDDDEGEDDEEKTKKKNHDGDDKEEKKERKKHHHGDDKGKEKKTKKHHQSNDDEEEEEKRKKQIHRHHHVEKERTKKRPRHNKNNNGNDSDDEDEQETTTKRWRKKVISRSRFGHGRRSQREEAQTEEVKN